MAPGPEGDGNDSSDGDAGEPAWRTAEREFHHPVIGRDTLPEMFEAAAERDAHAEAQLYKGGAYARSLVDDVLLPAPPGQYESISYGEMRAIVRRLAAGFRAEGIEPGDRVAILASTRMEWALCDFALLAAGAVVTTVYTESSAKQIEYLLEDPDATGVVVENEALLQRVDVAAEDLDLSVLVSMDELRGTHEDALTLGELHEIGTEAFDLDEYQTWLDERSPEDLASIIYTSGTTGRPKGVPLTHWNFRVNVNQVYRRLGPRPDKDPDLPVIDGDTRSIAFLPLAHVFERLAGHYAMFGAGAAVAYAENPDTLADDIATVKPTSGASVPRVYERIYDQMQEQASESPVKQRIFDWALDVAREYSRTKGPGVWLRLRHSVADKLVYSTVKENLGGNLEYMVSGGGSLARDLCQTFNGMGITVVEGYGLTETAPVLSVNPPEDIRPGTMGAPVIDVDLALDQSVVDADDFDNEGPIGELLVRGPNVVDEYWNKPGATDRAFEDPDAFEPMAGFRSASDDPYGDGTGQTDEGGGADDPNSPAGRRWFRTGDVVEVTDDEFLVYHDRRKQLIVLSTGKNVAPQPIEDAFSTSDRVDQIMVVGDERKFVGALIVPNFERLDRWAETEDVDLPEDRDAQCRDERVHEWVSAAVDAVNENFEEVERIKDFALVSEEWTADNDLLTPSMKKKRRNIRQAYAAEIDRIYDGHR